MSEEDNGTPSAAGFPRLTATIKLGYDLVTVRAEDGQELAEGLAEIAEVSDRLASAGTLIRNSFGISAAAEVNGSPPVQTRQGRNTGRTVKPGGQRQGARSGGSECEHGVPWNDCNGKTTKNGNLYKYRFYSTCGNDDCKPWGQQV